MRIVFIVRSTYGGERLGAQTLLSVAKEEGFDTFFYAHDSIPEENLFHQIEDIKPDVIAYSAMTYEHTTLQNLNQELKKRLSFISIFGGPHYTFTPEEIDSNEHMDVTCAGEGENAFRSFLKHLKNKTDYTKVNNLSVRHNKIVHKNPLGPLIANLDEVPFADRKVILLDKKDRQYVGGCYSVMVSRGCPYLCTYCFNVQYNKLYKTANPHQHVIRRRSAANVVAEMKKIKQEVNVEYFNIADDTFNLIPKDYIDEFCERYKEEIALPFTAQFRTNLVNEDIIKALKEAGMFSIYCAIECGDEEVSRNILKRGITNDQIRHAYRIFNKCKLKTLAQNMVGLPVENPVEDAWKTIKFNIENKVTYSHFTLLLPFPKTPMERYCKENGYLPESNNHYDLAPSVFTRSVLKFKTKKDSQQLENLHKFASIVVRYPFLIPLVKLLIKLPPNIVFQYIFFVWHGYNRTVVLRNVKWNFSLIFKGLGQISNYLRQHT